jgi:probable HAF family extracellular repeat protein
VVFLGRSTVSFQCEKQKKESHREKNLSSQSPWFYPRSSIFRWSGFRHQRLGTSRTFIPRRPQSKTVTEIGTLGGTYVSAKGINDAGQVAGDARHAFITGPDGMGMRDLGTLGGDYSTAWGINDTGQVVGESSTAGGDNHAFITGPDGMG